MDQEDNINDLIKEVIEDTPMYYLESWINGNKSHVVNHYILHVNSTSPIEYYFTKQFKDHPEIMEEIHQRAVNQWFTEPYL